MKYPGFGVPIGDYLKNDYSLLAKKATAVVFALLASGIIGACIAGPAGAAIGFTVVSAIALLCIAVEKIRNRALSYRMGPTFPQQSLVNDPNAPALGTYSTADIKISNCASESYEWRRELVSRAESSIEFSGNYAGGIYFRSFLDLIQKRMLERPQLRAHLLITEDLLEKADKRKLQELKAQFGERFACITATRVVCTSPTVRVEENHSKILVVDGKYFVIGGTGIHSRMTSLISRDPGFRNDGNFAAKLLNVAFRDTDIVGEGAVAQTLRNQFFALLQKWEMRMHKRSINRFFSIENRPQAVYGVFDQHPEKITQVRLKCIVGGPEHRLNNPITRKLTRRITKAKNDIRLATLYFNPDDAIKRALKLKKLEPVNITGYVNGTGSKNPYVNYIYAWPARYNYDLLKTAYEYDTRHYVYHKKVSTFDGKYTLVGSYNLGQKSAQCDDEVVVQIKDRRVTGLINRALDEDAKGSKVVTGSRLMSPLHKFFGAFAVKVLGPISG